ncbi:hypothetical protein AJ78_04863 [Emergomyces pasteurianus Ep9510]|uniref:TIGR02453 family protein n=1 Tax=Emergomyces pasteurianus Ep9510 TaxID=1447872 RepID=A0A1J9PEA8_9EURO|nr:hypothetical protein AJ78_04863 [Emergomyces pasteurianus Ep9510]
MTRRSSRLVIRSSVAEQQKKRASENISSSVPEVTRETKRLKASKGKSSVNETKAIKSAEKTSKYFRNQRAESTELSEVTSATPSTYEEGDEGSFSVPPVTDESESESKPTKSSSGSRLARGRKQKPTSTREEAGSSAKKKDKGEELWREGVRAGLGPGKEVFIKLPKAREAGDTPYEDNTIHPNTMLFLKDLKANNQREWLKMHDADFRTSKRDWDTFVESLTEKIMEKDSTIPELPAKDLVFRIYRDIRFSNDPTPYKPHFSAAWSRTGRKGPYAAYYVHVEPGKCFVGSGLWHPEAGKLALLRQDIDQNSRQIKNILSAVDVRTEIFNGFPKTEKEAILAFVSQNQESALKTKPKGYDADNENIDLLRLRSFTISKKIQDKDMLGPKALDCLARIVGNLVPFVTYLNSVVMPEPPDEDPSGDNGEEEPSHDDSESGESVSQSD